MYKSMHKIFREVPSRRTHLAFDTLPKKVGTPSKVVLGVDETLAIMGGDKKIADRLVLMAGDDARANRASVTYVGCDGKALFTVYPPT